MFWTTSPLSICQCLNVMHFFSCRHWIWCSTFKDSTESQYGFAGSLYRGIIQHEPQSMIQGGSWLTKCSKSCAVENNSSWLYSQGKPQECYANLTLKAPRGQSGRSSPQIQYSDIIQVEEPPESEREDEGCAEGASIVSDLYASVKTQRIKTIDPAGDGEGYANHLWEEVMVKNATCSFVHVEIPPLGGTVGLWNCAAISKQGGQKRSKSDLCWLSLVRLDCCSLKVCPVLLSPFWQRITLISKVSLYPGPKYYNFTIFFLYYCIIKMLKIRPPFIKAFIYSFQKYS